jgi:hypothetical protein
MNSSTDRTLEQQLYFWSLVGCYLPLSRGIIGDSPSFTALRCSLALALVVRTCQVVSTMTGDWDPVFVDPVVSPFLPVHFPRIVFAYAIEGLGMMSSSPSIEEGILGHMLGFFWTAAKRFLRP